MLELFLLLGTDSHTISAGVFGQFPTGVGNTDATFILELLHFIKKIEVLLVYKYNIINIIIKKVMLAMSCLMIGTYPIQGCG
jgi:homoaconitase/3-isopropylmalate dehydratase large subunit